MPPVSLNRDLPRHDRLVGNPLQSHKYPPTTTGISHGLTLGLLAIADSRAESEPVVEDFARSRPLCDDWQRPPALSRVSRAVRRRALFRPVAIAPAETDARVELLGVVTGASGGCWPG